MPEACFKILKIDRWNMQLKNKSHYFWTGVYNINTMWLGDTVRQTSRGLSFRGKSAWPYRVTTKYPGILFIQCKQTWVEMTLWNDKSYDFTNNCSPVRVWRRQPSQQLDNVAEGRRPELLFNTPRTLPNLQLRPIIYMEIFTEIDNISLWRFTVSAPGLPFRSARIPWNNNGLIHVTPQ